MIYREMPPLWDRAFRDRFYRRWGRESAVISARTRRAEYPDYTQLLSVKMVSGGSEDYFVDGRRICVDDETFLILNAGRRYGSRISAMRPVHSFSVFFAPGMAEEVQDSLLRSTEAQLANPGGAAAALEFDERLREHERALTPVLRHIERVVDAGTASDAWLDEQLRLLLGRMLRLELRQHRRHELIPSRRPATRRELHRRVGLGATFIHTHFHEPIGLADMARAAHLSPFHFLRTFRAVYGVTPAGYLSAKRTRAARRLMRESSWTQTEIAALVGFGSRGTLFRHLRASRP